ncbi:MAG: hypothetical protein ABIC68_05310 [Candidatus Omnitrophota bacterium]
MSKKTAVVVIHGIGEQKPFESLDAFVQSFAPVYEAQIKKTFASAVIKKKHSLVSFPGWVESFVSLEPQSAQPARMDIFEYYWAYMTQRQITFFEIIGWIFDVARGSCQAASDKSLSVKFKKLQYLCTMLSVIGFLRLLISIPASVFIVIPPLWRKISAFLKKPVVDFFGDVVLYTSSDQKSKFFPVRQKILDEAVKKVTYILKDMDYDEIVLVGHSLGTVIAYDVLDRLNKQMNVDAELCQYAPRLKGLVTFGSPLDKIAFFFDEKINKKSQSIRYAIVSQLHGFKRVVVDSEALENGVKPCFEHVKWLNFWTKGDPVCDSLSAYRDVENIEMVFPVKSKNPITNHGLYWQSHQMYQQIINAFFPTQPK